jgi:SAM-dependent methyltransferase
VRWRRCAPRERASPSRDGLLEQLRPHVADARVLEAVRTVPRDAFVPPEERDRAWENVPLPIGCGQTISQPLVVARMCELLALRGGERVLDVGTGSGYHAALLASLAAHVYSVELHAELSERAARARALRRDQYRRRGGGRDPPRSGRPARRRWAAGGARGARRPAARTAAPLRRRVRGDHARARPLRAARLAHETTLRRGFGLSSRPILACGSPSTITTSAVKSLAPRISDDPTP